MIGDEKKIENFTHMKLIYCSINFAMVLESRNWDVKMFQAAVVAVVVVDLMLHYLQPLPIILIVL